MKKTLIALAFLGSLSSFGQNVLTYQWQNVSNTQNTTSTESSNGIALDNATNTSYVIGTFSGTLNLPGASSINSAGGKDIYVAEINSAGNCTQILRLGTTGEDEGYGITYGVVGTTRYVYICGVENGEGVLYRLEANNLNTTNIRRTLVPQSSHPYYGTTGYCAPRGIAFYGGQVMVAGSYFNIVSFPTSAGFIHLTSSGFAAGTSYDYNDAFAARFANDLFCAGAVVPNQSGADVEVMGISCRNQRIYMTGYFKKDNAAAGAYNMPLKFNGASATMTAQGTRDIFVVSAYIPTGVPNAITFNTDQVRGGSGYTEVYSNSEKDCGYGITANGTAIFVTGNTTGPATFGTANVTGAGEYVARFNYNGSNIANAAPSWIYAGQNCSGTSGQVSKGYAMTSDANYIYAVGEAKLNTNMIGLTGSFCIGGEDMEGFVAKYDNAGNLIIAEKINQMSDPVISSGSAIGKSIAINGCYLAYTGVSYDDEFRVGANGNLPSITGSYMKRFFTVSLNPHLLISGNSTLCSHTLSTQLNANMIDGTNSYTYSWSPTTNLSSSTVSNPTFQGPGAGTYTYTVTANPVAGGCQATAIVTINVLTAVGDVVDPAGPNGCGASMVVGTPPHSGWTYSWTITGSGTLSCTTCAQPTATATNFTPCTFNLTATDACGNQVTDHVTLDPLCPKIMTGIGFTDNHKELTKEIYPNPNNGQFTIGFTDNTLKTIEVYNSTGQLVKKVNSNNQSLEVSLNEEPKGIYLVHISSENKQEVFRVVVE